MGWVVVGMSEHLGQTRATADTRRPPGQASLIDITAVADRLGVQVRHVRRLVHERRIPYVKWGHLLRFDPAEIDAWITEHRQTTRPRR